MYTVKEVAAEAEYYTVKTLAVKLDVSEKHLRDHSKRIPGYTKIGRAARYNKKMVDQALLSGKLF